MNKVRFLVMYVSSLILGNICIYIIDIIGNAHGKTPWTLQHYLIFNSCIFAFGILVSMLAENEKVSQFINKHFK